MEKDNNPRLNLSELSDKLLLSEEVILNLLKREKIPYFNEGGQLQFDYHSVVEQLQHSTCKTHHSHTPLFNEHGSLTTKYGEFLTTEEAADYLRVSVGSLRNMTSNGLVPFHKLGKRNRYFREDLRKLLLANRKGGFHGL